ncbi:MAG: CapA family protein [Candidatus Saccharimonas aalborgensis]
MGLQVRQQSRKLAGIALSTLVGLVVLAVLWLWLSASWPQRSTQLSSSHDIPSPQAATPVGFSNRTLHMGDVFWGRYINDWSMKSPQKYAYPFSQLNEFHREQYDAWVGNLECPSVDGVQMTSAQMEATLTFNCDPAYLPEAAKWFTMFSNANNHSDNQGAQAGLDVTRANLEKNHLQYFGHFNPEKLEDVCEVIAMPVKVTMSDGSVQSGALPMAYCGFHGVFRIPSQESLSQMERYSQYMPVIAYPHSGQEYKPGPDEIKTTLYRSMIDHGADAVIGDHPHWVQSTEVYKGHLIVYSMGNFLFDQQDTREVTRSAAIEMNLAMTPGADVSQLQQWLAIGKTCNSFHDDCLAQIKAKGLKKLAITYDFSVVGSDGSNKIVRPADTALQQSILQRLNWSATVRDLKAPYKAH